MTAASTSSATHNGAEKDRIRPDCEISAKYCIKREFAFVLGYTRLYLVLGNLLFSSPLFLLLRRFCQFYLLFLLSDPVSTLTSFTHTHTQSNGLQSTAEKATRTYTFWLLQRFNWICDSNRNRRFQRGRFSIGPVPLVFFAFLVLQFSSIRFSLFHNGGGGSRMVCMPRATNGRYTDECACHPHPSAIRFHHSRTGRQCLFQNDGPVRNVVWCPTRFLRCKYNGIIFFFSLFRLERICKSECSCVECTRQQETERYVYRRRRRLEHHMHKSDA